ncbi:uncharacterized protein DSM5745_05523 [Aspergillus mulundensis]|uniref:ARCA protein n=1 Tax=Aspergillus mulundensis TaxID=1810919 RepID=A0A3D8RXW7_9EURO|nr:Uncharacterized protein DSM5745_05523 [Aspergillus mulundensis]RDW78671.1 Uncharacterized protein DSM5745_05523 [Aspergillus mulundensis]
MPVVLQAGSFGRIRLIYVLVQYVDETPKFGHTAVDSSSGTPILNSSAAGVSPPTPAFTPSHYSHIYGSTPETLTTIDAPKNYGHAPWPRISPREACLLRYFIEELSRWFDLTDPHNNFATSIPQRARSNPILLDAILAASARHFSTLPSDQKAHIMSHYGLSPLPSHIHDSNSELSITEETVIHYHSRCIAELRVLANEPHAVMDEDLLAAVVVLRFFEELDNPFTSPPTETALHGLHVFLRAQASSALLVPGPRQASFWIGFRQEFNLAFSQQRNTNLPLEITDSYLIFTGAEDHVWTNRLVVLGARVLEFSYGSSPSNDLEFNELVRLRDEWVDKRPRSFAPIYTESPDMDTAFPKIWYTDDSHITAAQTLLLINILLLAYSPSIPRIGPSRRQTLESIDAQIRTIVLEICGMALSNRQSRPAGLTACIAINLCADRFTDPQEQRALMGLVVGTTRDSNYWPTKEAERRLRGIWGWDGDDD